MSININSYQEVPYIGAPPQSVGINNCAPLTTAPGAVPVLINWADYVPPGQAGVSIRIPMDINVGVRVPLEKIAAVYIDNSSNDYPVFIQFPDTQYGVSVSPNSIQWFPVITNAFKVNFASDFIPNFVGSTRIIFTNITISPIEASQLLEVSPEWLGTNPNSRIGNIVLGSYRRAPSLGDILYSSDVIIGTGTRLNILGNPDVNDLSIITYLKEIYIRAVAPFSLPYISNAFARVSASTYGQTGFVARGRAWLYDNGASDIIHLDNIDVRCVGGVDLLYSCSPNYPVVDSALILEVNIAYTMRQE